MLILKSYFRKKTTKIYIIIYTFILFCIYLLLLGNNILFQKENSAYEGSMIILKTQDISKLSNIKNIKEVVKSKTDDFNAWYLVLDNNLQDNNIIIPNKYYYDGEFKITINKEGMILNPIDNYSQFSNYIYVSEYIYNKCNSDTYYLIFLNNYLKQDETIKELTNIYGFENVIGFNNNSTLSTNNKTYLFIIKILLIFLIILFIGILLITSYNTIRDEESKNELYYKLGYKYKTLKLYNIIKIILSITIPFIITLIIFFIISILLSLNLGSDLFYFKI